MESTKSFNSFINESKSRLERILRNLTKDDDFIQYLQSKGKEIDKVHGVELSMGLCAYVAKYIEEVHKIGKALASQGPKDAPVSHAFIKYKNRYYDAGSPNGVDNVWELFNFDDASYSTNMEYEDYKKLIQKNIKSYSI